MIRTVPRTVVVEKFVAGDREFDTREDAERYEVGLKHFQDMLSGKWNDYHLPKGVALNTVGYWLIKNEGGVDFSSQVPPLAIGACHGTLRNAIKYACTELNGFWGYGPGRIEILNVAEV